VKSGKTLSNSINNVQITEAEIKLFSSLTRTEVLKLSPLNKIKYLYSFQVKHKNLEDVAMDLMMLLNPFNETNILFLIGATGVGKTTLVKRLIRVVVEKLQAECRKKASIVSLIFIPAPANGEKSLSWVSVYEKILKASNEILVKKKQANVIENGIMTVQPRKYKNLQALRDALESMLKNRKVRVLAIDEAYHMLRFGNYSAVMDTLKQISEGTNVKLLLIGSYNLLDLACDYGQVSRRAEILHFERYHRDCDTDEKQFADIVEKIQENWPCEIIPNFSAISKELMEASLGCIGLLKSLMLRALVMQLENKGKWNPIFLSKAAKSMKLLESIKKEIEHGEAKIKGATYGESLFTGKYLTDAIAKMNLDTANV
jgi:hypothetical protein